MTLRVSEHREGASEARQATLQCRACGKRAFVTFPWDVTPVERQRIIKAALDEHRKIGCPASNAEARIVYDVLYPRR